MPVKQENRGRTLSLIIVQMTLHTQKHPAGLHEHARNVLIIKQGTMRLPGHLVTIQVHHRIGNLDLGDALASECGKWQIELQTTVVHMARELSWCIRNNFLRMLVQGVHGLLPPAMVLLDRQSTVPCLGECVSPGCGARLTGLAALLSQTALVPEVSGKDLAVLNPQVEKAAAVGSACHEHRSACWIAWPRIQETLHERRGGEIKSQSMRL